MTEVAVVRCGEPHGKRAPKLAALAYEDRVLVVTWQAPSRDPVRWEVNDAGQDVAVTPVRLAPHERKLPATEVLRRDHWREFDTWPEAYMVLYCKDHGRVLGPRWLEFVRGKPEGPARAGPRTYLARRRGPERARRFR